MHACRRLRQCLPRAGCHNTTGKVTTSSSACTACCQPRNSQQNRSSANALSQPSLSFFLQALALKHAKLGGDADAIAHIKKEVAIMKALRGSANILTLRSVAFAGPSNKVLSLRKRSVRRLVKALCV